MAFGKANDFERFDMWFDYHIKQSLQIYIYKHEVVYYIKDLFHFAIMFWKYANEAYRSQYLQIIKIDAQVQQLCFQAGSNN